MLLVISILCISYANAHSWAECTKYDDAVVAPYTHSKCKGFPRAFQRQFTEGFGIDTGFNDEVGAGAATIACPVAYNANLYNNEVVMANYTPGEVFNMAWPAKNHVADTCTNQFIPDGGVVILRSSLPETDDFLINIPMINPQHVNGQIDHLGFQRCFQFCNNMDKSPCYNTFQLDKNFYKSGVYSFKWVWTFNPGQYFITCFDAYVNVDNPVIVTSSSNTGDNYTDSMSGSSSGTIEFPTPATTVPLTTTPTPSTVTPTPSVTTSTPSTTSPTPSVTTSTPSTTSPNSEVTSNSPGIGMSFTNHLISGLITLNITGWFNTTDYFNT